MAYKKYDLVLVEGTALDTGSYNKQPWSAIINNQEQLIENWTWINKDKPSLREIEPDQPIVLIAQITGRNTETKEWVSELGNQSIHFSTKNIIGYAHIEALYTNESIVKPKSEINQITDTSAEVAKKPKRKTKKKPEFSFDDYNQIMTVGSDEVGTGSYFGGITTAAVYIKNQEDLDFLKSLKVNDSKKVTDKKVRELAPQIREKLAHYVTVVQPGQYNNQTNNGANANAIKAISHNFGLSILLHQYPSAKNAQIIIDEFTSQENYNSYINTFGPDGMSLVNPDKTLHTTKAESKYLAVAAASILAREAFLDQMDKLSDIAGEKLLQGVNAKSKVQIKKLLKENKNLHKLGKLHFKTTQELLDEIEKEKLSESNTK